jgi:ribosomal protein S18 acetylase RimI-like enzyme
MSAFSIKKADDADFVAAYTIVSEYYEAASVIARETQDEFRSYYFSGHSGFWLAYLKGEVVGCIALRELTNPICSGEIKRMYVQPAHRQHGIAKALLTAIEVFAMDAGYDWLYLDSAPGMDTAINFYKRHGYAECDRYNDNPQANIFLRKPLR